MANRKRFGRWVEILLKWVLGIGAVVAMICVGSPWQEPSHGRGLASTLAGALALAAGFATTGKGLLLSLPQSQYADAIRAHRVFSRLLADLVTTARLSLVGCALAAVVSVLPDDALMSWRDWRHTIVVAWVGLAVAAITSAFQNLRDVGAIVRNHAESKAASRAH